MAKPTDESTPPPFPSPQQALEFMQRMWNPLGVPMPGFGMPGAPASPAMAPPTAGGLPFPNPAMMFAALDPVEVERKIQELRVVENWLAMTLSMMQMSIKTLELQKASLEAMRGSAPARSAAGPKKGGER